MSDEAFLSDTEITEQKNLDGSIIKVSAESGNVVDWMEEENYKFRLSAFQDDLKYWLKDGIRNIKFRFSLTIFLRESLYYEI